MNIILFGPPGAGKGTQAKFLVNILNNFQVSTGDMLRDEIKKDSEIGKKIISFMSEGKFVDDEIVNSLMKNVVLDSSKKGKLIFDGYPRTTEQAKNLDILLKESNQQIDFIFFLNVNKETIIKRIKHDQNRPTLEVGISFEEEQKKILKEREQKYHAAADYICNTSNRRPVETVQEITDFLKTEGWI